MANTLTGGGEGGGDRTLPASRQDDPVPAATVPTVVAEIAGVAGVRAAAAADVAAVDVVDATAEAAAVDATVAAAAQAADATNRGRLQPQISLVRGTMNTERKRPRR